MDAARMAVQERLQRTVASLRKSAQQHREAAQEAEDFAANRRVDAAKDDAEADELERLAGQYAEVQS